MHCPICGHTGSKVLDKRETPDGVSNRRRRQCLKCKRRFTTYERHEKEDIIVVKRDGSRELFEPGKIRGGIMKAFWKRKISAKTIDALVEQIDNDIRASGGTIKSRKIGELVMEHLKKVDEVAYIRFASVYRRFSDIKSFEKELAELKK
ncbi:transcriptional regulator NrdR [Candidatus Woesearchaeota archaeon CG1_02_57_44]|nr:MAG: transcriptional regulator NrdR [Candidatus Woesearchaeota archaeon CG1_02_57_44]